MRKTVSRPTDEILVRTARDGDWYYSPKELEDGLRNHRIQPDWPARRQADTEWTTAGELFPNIALELLSYHPPEDAHCYLLRNGEQQGPFVPAQLRTMWASGQLTADARYWFDSLDGWFPVSNVVSASGKNASERPQKNVVMQCGIVAVLVGVAIAAFFFLIYDTSISAASGELIYNDGLMQNRLLGGLTGIVIAGFGGFMCFWAKKEDQRLTVMSGIMVIAISLAYSVFIGMYAHADYKDKMWMNGQQMDQIGNYPIGSSAQGLEELSRLRRHKENISFWSDRRDSLMLLAGALATVGIIGGLVISIRARRRPALGR